MITIAALLGFLSALLMIIGKVVVFLWTLIKTVYVTLKIARALHKTPTFSDVKKQFKELSLGKAKTVLKDKLNKS